MSLRPTNFLHVQFRKSVPSVLLFKIMRWDDPFNSAKLLLKKQLVFYIVISILHCIFHTTSNRYVLMPL